MNKRIFLIALIVAFMGTSCSSDDDATTPSDQVDLVGTWQLTHVDFTTFEEDGIPASDACVIELVAGYQFKQDHSLYVLLTRPLFDPYAQEYWSWSGTTDDFEIIQNNPSMPPYNFGLIPENIELTTVEGKPQLKFHAEMANGSAAYFTLVKQAIDTTQAPALTKPDGSDYHCGFFEH